MGFVGDICCYIIKYAKHQAVIEIITCGCVWYDRGKDGKNVVCKFCKRDPDSVEHFLYSCTMFKNDVNDMFNYVC